jgi:hypothetical protein
MSDKKLRFYNVLILLCFAFLGLALGGAISLVVLALKGLGDPVLLAWLGLLDYLLSVAFVAWLIVLFAQRKRFLAELSSLSEMFGSTHFVYTRENLEAKLASLKEKHRLEGVVVALNPRDLYGDVRQMYGSEAIRNINTIIMSELLQVFGQRDDCFVAFSSLDGFFVYEDTLDNRAFYSEMVAASEAIKKSLRADGALPALKILMGSYVLSPIDEPSNAVSMALLAENFHSSGRLSDEVVEYHDDMVERGNLLQDLSKEIERGLVKEEFKIFDAPPVSVAASSPPVITGASGPGSICQPGDPGALTGDEKLDLAIDDLGRHRGDVVQRLPRFAQYLPGLHQMPVRHQLHQRHATIRAAHHDEDPVADGPSPAPARPETLCPACRPHDRRPASPRLAQSRSR